MKALLGLGKLIALLFWLAVLANLIQPFAHPFALLLNAAGALILLIHILEVLALRKRLQGARIRAWIACRSCCSASFISRPCRSRQWHNRHPQT